MTYGSSPSTKFFDPVPLTS
ncbi:hypothetical protein Gohar_018469 [Gossypium harknessii]|uniref:Uncharacterized protein n=2 Tax=Gossypium TaxID=3633 RepID=A0A7J8WSY3_GOSAI|nr:hypothetical protein [Gossypium aridum]MBA0794111.1 hypothetical protein [Gossypium harknessii]